MQAYSYLVIFTLFVVSEGVLFVLNAGDKKKVRGLVLLLVSMLMAFSVMPVGKAENNPQQSTSESQGSSSKTDVKPESQSGRSDKPKDDSKNKEKSKPKTKPDKDPGKKKT